MKGWLLLFVVGTATASFPCYYDVTSATKASKAATGTSHEIFGGTLSMRDDGSGRCAAYGTDITPLFVQATAVTNDILRVKIADPNDLGRWQVPHLFPDGVPTYGESADSFAFSYTASPFTFSVSRADGSDSVALFNTSISSSAADFGFLPLVFEDQYIEVSTSMMSSPTVYGLGEVEYPFALYTDATDYVQWTSDPWDMGVRPGVNLYGDYPLYVEMRKNAQGRAHGVFVANSNAKRFSFAPAGEALSIRLTGGVLDLFFFMGPTGDDVVKQYLQVVGNPILPPYWALGYHQSGLGQSNELMLNNILDEIVSNNLTCDVIWSDIDYMLDNKDFTFSLSFTAKFATDYIAQLNSLNMVWVPILDHCIPIDKTNYEPYTLGIEKDVFVKDIFGDNFYANLWAGDCYIPDFSHPNTLSWWVQLLKTFYEDAPFSGIWIDMDEPSNICSGSCQYLPTGTYNFPPFNPLTTSDWYLFNHTVSLDSPTYLSLMYNTHNMYGYFESTVTHDALVEMFPGKRPFVLTRSSSFGTGTQSFHWLGDNDSSFSSLKASVPGTLSFQLFGIPFVGPDICGFNTDATAELCTRWFELGAFYPFARNHNSDAKGSPQYPWTFGQETLDIFKTVFEARYKLLPFFYTLAFQTTQGGMMWRPLSFQYPTDGNTYSIDTQALIGDALLLSPVLEEAVEQVTAYLPSQDRWYDFWTLGEETRNGWVVLDAPLEVIPVHIRGGSIIPLQRSASTSAAARLTPFTIIVAQSAQNTANGELYLDDGVSLDVDGLYSFITFNLAGNVLTSTIEHGGYIPSKQTAIESVVILGAKSATSVQVNGASYSNFSLDTEKQVLTISGLSLTVTTPFMVKWN